MSISEASPAIDPVAERIPLSFNQGFLLMFDKGDAEGPFGPKYFFPSAWRLSGRLDLRAVRAALTDLVARHEILRTEVVRDGGSGYQRVRPPVEPRLEVRDRPEVGAAEADRIAEELLIEIEASEYSFQEMPLLHAVLVRLAGDESILALIVHHAAVDTWSLQILIRDFATCYALRTGHLVPALPPLRQYQEFTRWELARASGPEMTRAADYWRAKLRDGHIHTTRNDHPRSAGLPKGTAAHRFLVDTGLTAQVMNLSKGLRCSPFMVMLAAYEVFLRNRTGESDLTVTTISSGRGHAPFHDTVGSFFNFVPLRTDLAHCATFRDAVNATRTTCLEAYSHEMPFPSLVSQVPELMASLGDDQTLIAFQVFQEPFTVDRRTVGGIRYADVRRRLVSQPVTVDVPDGALWTLELDPTGDTVGSLLYNTNLFDEATMVTMADEYCQLLRRLVAEPDAPLADRPDTATERTVHEIWRAVLGAPDGTDGASFFELNGDSMSAVRIVARIEEELGVQLDVADMFEADPTLPELVRSVLDRAMSRT